VEIFEALGGIEESTEKWEDKGKMADWGFGCLGGKRE
jgi:hypothetical protein